MDVDPSPSTSLALDFMHPPGVSTSLPKIDEDSALEPKTAKQRLIKMLDILESHVEKLRKEAVKLEEDRDSLLASLDSVRNADLITELNEFEHDDIQRYLDRIVNRCLTIELRIHTQRDQTQEDALFHINHLIDSLVKELKVDPESAKTKCITYMNACSAHFVQGSTDKKFENYLLGCTLDDQKKVKKRLQGLLNYFDKPNASTEIQ